MSDYFKNPAISQSALTNFSYGPQYYKSKSLEFKEDSEALTIGTAVDLKLFEPEKFKESFTILEIDKPSNQLGDFVDALAEIDIYNPEIKLSLPPEMSSEEYAYQKAGIKRDSLAKIMQRFESEGGLAYYKQLQHSKDKVLLTNEQYQKVLKIYNSLVSNKYTSPFLFPTFGENKLRIPQLEIYWKYQTTHKLVDCKSKIDLLLIDFDNKTIKVIDLKTTGYHTSAFRKSFLQFRYDLQASFYLDAVKQWLRTTDYKDFVIEGFYFVVESTKYIGTPLIYKCTEKDIYCGKYGGLAKDGREYDGYDQLINELTWHIDHNTWDYEKEAIENNGIVEIDAFCS